jgi:outer membrane cobalamin receptor
VADAVARLPYVSARGARGSAVVSLRGGRAEHTVVTLDGLALNDPATGIADLADLPLAAVGAATALPGADAVRAGSGAVGGTVALASADRPLFALRAGSYGERLAEGAAAAEALGGRLRVGGSWAEARNDFPFVNRAAATGGDTLERRVNNDERRAALFATASWPALQLLFLATDAERGLVGPMNVRAYDADRGRTRRALARAGAQAGAWTISLGARALEQRYDDARTPQSDSRADAAAVDGEVARALGGVSVRAGGGVDRLGVRSSTPVAPRLRGRAFASAAREWRAGRWLASAGVRGDAYERSGARPSWSLGLERAARVTAFARAAQAFRAPTLYDLYLGAPRRLAARDLRPERVALDAELGARARVGGALLEGAAFHRVTRDAIIWFPGNFDWSPANVGTERAAGAEARANVEGEHAGVSAWAGWYHARLHGGGLVIPTPYAPYAAGGGTATLRRGPVTAAATLRAMGRRPFASAPRSHETELPGVALASLQLGARAPALGHSAQLFAGVENLGDVRWESIERFPSPGRTWSAGLTLTP